MPNSPDKEAPHYGFGPSPCSSRADPSITAPAGVTSACRRRLTGMSTAAHLPVAKDALTALAPLITYPARCWLALSLPPSSERRPAAATYFESGARRKRHAA